MIDYISNIISAGIIQWLEFIAIVDGGALMEWEDE